MKDFFCKLPSYYFPSDWKDTGLRRNKIMMTINDGLYIGVDGCKGGWIASILDHGDLLLKQFDSLEALI